MRMGRRSRRAASTNGKKVEIEEEKKESGCRLAEMTRRRKRGG